MPAPLARPCIGARTMRSDGTATMSRFGDNIRIRGARQHNLKNIDLDIPRNQLVVVTGVSGSGKSSLVFDTLYAEGQRRYLESFPGYARQFVRRFDAPKVDWIDGLSPAIAIEQKALISNPRSTVATLTEILDSLRLLFTHLGTVHCPGCGRPVRAYTTRQIVQAVFAWPLKSRLLILAPLGSIPEQELAARLQRLRREGFARVRIHQTIFELDPPPRIPRRPHYRVDLVVDRIILREDQQRRLSESIELGLKMGNGQVRTALLEGEEKIFSERFACTRCNLELSPPSPDLFSFTHPTGACNRCNGTGRLPSKKELGSGSPVCSECGGSRFNRSARSVRLNGLTIDAVCDLPLEPFSQWLETLSVAPALETVADRPRRAIRRRTAVLEQLGLAYLSLGRAGASLSSGEAQRVRLARQLSAPLSGVLYALDEPSVGLHARDHHRLLDVLEQLRDRGNSLIVVEHDLDTLRRADYVIDMGPGAGPAGGAVLFAGLPGDLAATAGTSTGQYLAGCKQLTHPAKRNPFQHGAITLEGASGNNLKDLTVRFPLGCITCVTGVSGAGKSTLVMDTLHRAMARLLYRSHATFQPYRHLHGTESIDHAVAIDQTPIGRTSKSTPATYTGIFQLIRNLFASLPEAKARGYTARRFSFNAKGGRCEVCRGEGVQAIEMVFLPDVFVTCSSCGGSRYTQETMDIRFKGQNIAEVLKLTVNEALQLFLNLPAIRTKLDVLQQVGLGYLQLGQSAVTLSGGEAQRIRLARELGRRLRGHALYLMDEPTTGLHLDDIQQLLDLLQRLAGAGHTIVMIEHHLEVIRAADYVIDLGPEGGPEGGKIVAEGAPEQLARAASSATGQALKHLFQK